MNRMDKPGENVRIKVAKKARRKLRELLPGRRIEVKDKETQHAAG